MNTNPKDSIVPAKYQDVYQKVFVDGKDVFEAARELGVTIDTVRVHKAKLEQLIKEEKEDDRESQREPIENALYATGKFKSMTPEQCSILSNGIIDYLNDAGFKIVPVSPDNREGEKEADKLLNALKVIKHKTENGHWKGEVEIVSFIDSILQTVSK
jgi:hypothetical protein